MGTYFCDVTMTSKQQEKIGNIFFRKQETRKCMFDTFTQNSHGITQLTTLFGHPNSFNSFSLLVILNAPVHSKLAYLCSLSSCSLSYMVQES